MRWKMLRRARKPAGDEPGGAGGLQRLADRDQRAKQDQYRPLDGVVRFLKRQQLKDQHRHRGAEEADRHRHRTGRHQDHRDAEDHRRQVQVARAPEGYVPLGERQAAERGQLVVDALGTALQHQEIAVLEANPAQALRDPAPGAAERQQVEAMALAQRKLLDRAADHRRVRRDNRLHDHQLFRARVAQGKLLAVDQLELGGIDQPGQRMRVGLEDENVAIEERPVSGRDVAPVSLPNDGSHRDVAIAQRFELPDGLANAWRSPRADVLR